MQLSIDGFVARPDGALDWMTWNIDDKLKQFVMDLTDSFDTILLGRKMTDGFVQHWEAIVNDPPKQTDESSLHWSFDLAQRMVNYKKIVFSRSQKTIDGKNISITNDDVVNVVNKLKAENGKDIVVYGGADFVSSLIKENLVDEFNLFINPAAIGNGLKIFHDTVKLQLIKSTAYECGAIVNTYKKAV